MNINMEHYPKILIIGHSFQNTGIGITLKNLFSRFPKDRLACAASGYCENDVVFRSFYLLGHKEIKLAFPFRLFQNPIKSKIIDKPTNDEFILRKNKSTYLKHYFYKRYIYSFLHRAKLYNYRLKYSVSQELIHWMKAFDPDVIYSALGTLNMTKFVADIHSKIPNAKLAIHIMDDWLATQSEQVIFSKRHQKQLSLYFNKLVKDSSIRLVISDKMAEEYYNRYKIPFYSFHNPVDISEYIGINKKSESKSIEHIVYIGKINKDNYDVINDIISAVNKINDERECLIFDIYTPTDPLYVKMHILNSSNVVIHRSIPHQQVPALLLESDILVLPLSFAPKSKKYTRLSLSTKITEFMAAKKPIIVYAPSDIALTEYVTKYRIALTVTERNVNLLAKEINRLINDTKLVNDLTNRAFSSVQERHTLSSVCHSFEKLFKEIN